MIKKVLKTIRKYNLIERGDQVVLGLSGGPDSVCLLHVLNELREEFGFGLTAVHVNHMLREGTAQRDEEFAAQTCEKLGVSFKSFNIDCKAMAERDGLSSEEAGRKARYGAFRQVADELSAGGNRVKIAVAHNADDQAETLLFRILRGTGTDGLAGMEHARAEGEHVVIRPLLDVTRSEIEEYLDDNSIEFVTDETNSQAIYTRNKIRLEMLPFIKENFNENIVGALGRLADVAATDKAYIWEQAEAAYQECLVSQSSEKVVLDQSKVAELHEAIRHRVILRGLRHVGMWEDVTHERLLAADDMLCGDSSTKVLELPHGYKITFAFGEISIKGRDIAARVRSVEVEILDSPERVSQIKFMLKCAGYREGELLLDVDKVCQASGLGRNALVESISIRSRREGDFIPLRGGRKKLKKLMGEMKIPADERDDVQVIAAGQCVLFIGDADGRYTRYAETLRVDDKTEAILNVKVV